MKKKIIICLLVLLLFPFSVKAYTYTGSKVTRDTLLKNNYIKVWPKSNEVQKFYVGSSNTSSVTNDGEFYFHSATEGSNYFIGHSSNIGKTINNTLELNKIETFSTLENNSNNLSNEQRKLLEDLITNGYQFDTTNTQKVSKITSSKDSTLSMMAMQILVWEVMEGGRTDFTSIPPNAINESTSNYRNSFYKQLVYPNGGETNENGTLYYYYKKIINSVKAVTDPESSTAFNTDVYSLSWDGTNKKYTTTVNGLGKYTSCTSSISSVKVSTSGTTAVITSNNLVDEAKITCSYAVGGGTNNDFYYFKTPDNYTNIIYGSARKVYTRSFNVTTKTTSLKIKSVNLNKESVDGPVFKFTHRTTTSYSFNVTANSKDSKDITKSGEFIVSEVSVPKGYEKISDFNIIIDTSNNIVRDCTNKGVDQSGNTTCANGRIVVTKEDGVLVLTITSLEKNFKIIKTNENNDIIKGTTFEIRDNNGNAKKFTYNNGMFVYNQQGSKDIVLNDSGTYAIAMLPEGDYSIVETKPVLPYRLPSKNINKSTKIRIDSKGDLLIHDSSQDKFISPVNSSIIFKNYRTLVKIMSVKNASPMPDMSYSLYASDKTTLIKASLDQEGIYNYVEDQTSSEGTTDFRTNSSGIICIYDLPVGTYYFKSNSDSSSSFIKVVIDVTKKGATVNGNVVINTISLSADKDAFSFYKTDEDGNYLGGGQFKLQRYDNNKARYVDLKLVQETNDGTYNPKSQIFKEDDNGKRVFTLENGIATFIDMKPGSQYRIVETKAPDGYALQSLTDTAEVTIDDSGNAYGLLVLTNKKVSDQPGQAQAELIINIDTGQTRIKYALIIGSIVIIIGALLLIQRKKK